MTLGRLTLASQGSGTDMVVASAGSIYRSECALLRWDRQSGEPIGDPVLFQVTQVYPAFRDPLVTAATPAGPVAATRGEDGGMQLWDLVTGQPARRAAFTAIHVDRAGVPFGFVYVGDVDEDDPGRGARRTVAAGQRDPGRPAAASHLLHRLRRRRHDVDGALRAGRLPRRVPAAASRGRACS